MMKSLTTALGALTILTVTGMATPPGQAMLGIRHAQTSTPVSVIADPGPAKVATPAPAPVAAPAPATVGPRAAAPAPRPAVAAPAARPVVTHPAAAPAPVASAPGPAAAPAGPMGGGAGQIANILLNLPQVLGQGTQGVPGVGNGDEGTPPRVKKEHKHQGDSNNAGDYEH